MPLAPGRDWSPLAARFDTAADRHAETAAVVWWNRTFDLDAIVLGDRPAEPLPTPPTNVATGIRLDAARGEYHSSPPWVWGVVFPEDKARHVAAAAVLDTLVGDALAGAVAEPGRPNPTGGGEHRRGFLLSLVADGCPNKRCHPDGRPRVWLPFDRWPEPGSVRWKSLPPDSRERPDWWCVVLPNVFRRVGEFLKSLPQTLPLARDDGLLSWCGGAIHGLPDLSVIYVGGSTYHLNSDARRDVIRLLMDRWGMGEREVRKEELLTAAGTDQSDLRAVFRSGNATVPAWGGVVRLATHQDGRQKRGYYRLNIPDPGP